MLELVEDFAALCEAMPKAQPYILVVDDLDRYDQSALPATYDRIVKTERSRLIGSIEWRNLSGYTQNSMLLELRREPTMLILQPDSAGDVLQMTGVRAQLRPGLPMAAGRGILIAHRQPTLLQVATRRRRRLSAAHAGMAPGQPGGASSSIRPDERSCRPSHASPDPRPRPRRCARPARDRPRHRRGRGLAGRRTDGLVDPRLVGSGVVGAGLVRSRHVVARHVVPETSEPVITAPTPDPSASFQPAPIEWSMDALGDGVDEGHLVVPIDYANPDAGTFTLYLTRHRATGDRVGSLLINPGGPGVAGSDFGDYADQIFDQPPARRLRHHRLGSARHRAHHAGDRLHRRLRPLLRRYRHHAGRRGRAPGDRRPRQGVHRRLRRPRTRTSSQFVGTNNSARDMDSIRKALGEDTISYFGFSYGSELGATWATLFPDTVRAAVLDSAIDPNADALQETLVPDDRASRTR